MLNLRKAETQSIEITGEGESRYRFTFARFSAPERQRHISREEVAKRYTAEMMNVSMDSMYEMFNRHVNGIAIKREEQATFDLMMAALAWARIISALVSIERFDEQWYPESVPSEWETPEGFLGNFESFREVFELDNVVITLNRSLFGLRNPDDAEKKRDGENTASSETASANSPSQSTTTKSQRTRSKKSQKT